MKDILLSPIEIRDCEKNSIFITCQAIIRNKHPRSLVSSLSQGNIYHRMYTHTVPREKCSLNLRMWSISKNDFQICLPLNLQRRSFSRDKLMSVVPVIEWASTNRWHILSMRISYLNSCHQNQEENSKKEKTGSQNSRSGWIWSFVFTKSSWTEEAPWYVSGGLESLSAYICRCF